MNKRIQQYIEQLFATAPRTAYVEDLKEEMLSNLLEKYEDLLIEGKTKEEAYIIVTSSVGDIRELLSGLTESAVVITTKDLEKRRKKSALIISASVMLFILAGANIILFELFNLENVGVVVSAVMVAVGVGMLIYDNCTKPDVLKDDYKEQQRKNNLSPREKKNEHIKNSINGAVWSISVVVFLLIGMGFDAWDRCWIVFLIALAANASVDAMIDLRGHLDEK